ncbi:S-formylglutathione hydrolase [Draconibacterium sp.]|jgi:S-formylglutathione hydrolase|nr:S-formylglutathione hydrolase [Luminiphilus sp.]MDB3923362.1 S-formylglutathione hydrolase [Luminiphilus sp.]MDB4583384.1 S-formylglutathione hydrolase [Draconibacterium sp.]MDC6485400.1 S-formylglutathione hydrolase [Luminiphilus sp.]
MAELIDSHLCFGGEQRRYRHRADSLACDMVFSVFLPPQAASGPVPVLYYLSGLTCTDENFVAKAGAQQFAAEHGIAIVAPDTSPRGDGVPDDPEGSWDFGLGAGFYVNATQAPWNDHYRMYDYIVEELPKVVGDLLPIDADRSSITGHSMGGHGALTIGLRNPSQFQSISAFSPICSPSECPWGHKALGNYLGANTSDWLEHDASHLIGQANTHLPILVDQGGADGFLVEQLKPELLLQAATRAEYPITLRVQAGYDHSYFFVASFIAEHLAFHAKYLNP